MEMDDLRVGPDLLGVTQKRHRTWLARWLAEPEKMLAEKDPIVMELHAKYKNVPMPNMRLNEVEVASLIDYMDRRESQNGGGATDRARLLRSARELRGSLDSLHGSLARLRLRSVIPRCFCRFRQRQ